MAAENTPTEKVCPGDCLQCTRVQQLYCASQGNIEIHKTLETVIEILNGLNNKVNGVTEEIKKLSQAVSELDESKATQVVKKGKAPKSSGADN